MTALLNRAFAPKEDTKKRKRDDAKKVIQAREDWTWRSGDPVSMTEWPDYGDLRLVECGRLIRFHFRAPPEEGRHPRRERDTMFEISQNIAANCYIAFDYDDPGQRLYMLLDPKHVMPIVKQRFWHENNMPAMPLGEVASWTRGRHSDPRSYEHRMVKPFGAFVAVVYHTKKNGDGISYYIHRMGEETQSYPILCADEEGRVWIAGGDYTAPPQGITN